MLTKIIPGFRVVTVHTLYYLPENGCVYNAI